MLATCVALAGGCAPAPYRASQAEASADQYHRLVGVVSGDTLVVTLPEWNGGGQRDVNVRCIGVRAPLLDPERQQYGGQRAADAVARLVGGGWVRLEFNNAENRPLLAYDGSLVADQEAYVFVPPPADDPAGHELFLNEWLLDEGFAERDSGVAEWDRGTLGRYKPRLDRAADRARAAGRGLWALPR
jgi:endonuclease YncB( thermonuclease family)